MLHAALGYAAVEAVQEKETTREKLSEILLDVEPVEIASGHVTCYAQRCGSRSRLVMLFGISQSR